MSHAQTPSSVMPTSYQSGLSLRLPPAQQWLTGTPGRIAPDRYSWMQAVCWFHLDDIYTAGQRHGPRRVGPTTVRVAVALGRLSPCRPGVDYLVRTLRLARRTVQYHLAILREAGLLAYRSKGTRVSGQIRLASEYAFTIPPAFDEALGLRTAPSERYIRAVRGIEDAGRRLMRRLARLAQQALRWPHRRTTKRSRSASLAALPCTPMGGGSSTSSSAGYLLPSESKLEAGQHDASNGHKSRTLRRLNTVGRRYHLARELIQQVPWLHRASIPRIAWILRDVSDAGWSITEIVALLGQHTPPHTVHRPSGYLAHRLRGAHLLYDTPAKRGGLVTWWRDARQARADRHTEWEATWQTPRSRAVTRLVDQALAAGRQRHASPEPVDQEPDPAVTKDELLAHRDFAKEAFNGGDTSLIASAIHILGREETERLYGTDLVADTLHVLQASSHLTLGLSR